MKTKLLSLILTAVLYSGISKAQTKVWDFGNDTTTWPLSAGIGTNPMVVDNLGLYPIPTNTNFGAVTANSASFSDGFTAVNRFQMNGAGYPSGPFQAMPTQRYLFIDVSGACTVKVWFKTGSNSAVRTMYVSDGTAAVGSATTNSGSNADLAILSTSYTGGAGRLYIYGDSACNLYKVSVTGATVNTVLANEDFQLHSSVDVFSNGKLVSIENVLSATEVKVFSITGALVKSFTTSSDMNFDLNSGLYVVNVKSAEGQKAVKVAIQ